MNKILYILRGIPGAGKSTLAKQLVKENCIFEADKFFIDIKGDYKFDANKLPQAHHWCKLLVETAMLKNKTSNNTLNNFLCVSNTSTTEKEIQPYIDLALKYDYKVVSVIVENRHNGVNQHGVPEESLIKMENRLKNNIKLR